nr:MAG TPA: hypothetical protein [Caudoviricetes sp.]
MKIYVNSQFITMAESCMKMSVKVCFHTLLLSIVTIFWLISQTLYLISSAILKCNERKVVT